MIIYLFGKRFSIYGYPVIEGNITKAYAIDEHTLVYLLIWKSGEQPNDNNVNILIIDNSKVNYGSNQFNN